MRKIRVLIVDDSASVRQTLTEVLASDPEIEVMGTAADPFIAVERMRHGTPDVITLDLEMQRMDGLTFLDRIMSQHPIPVVICSGLTEGRWETALMALEKGAVEVIGKPSLGTQQFLRESCMRICDAVKAAAHARVRGGAGKPRPPVVVANVPVRVQPKLSADVILGRPAPHAIPTTEKIIVVGASTGGTEALREFLEALPVDAPGVLIVQHMPEHFTARFAERLDTLCKVRVAEAVHGDTVHRGTVLIAPGNRHMLLRRSGARYYVELKNGPLVSRHRPSVDVLFRSAALCAGKNAVGVIMTGMGDDGARGMLEMRECGSINIAQDERTSVVFGMPAEAIKLGAVHRVLGLSLIAEQVVKFGRSAADPKCH